MKKILLILVAVIALSSVASAEKIGKITTSGMIFKDTLEIHVFEDPTIKGIACYVTLPKKTLSIEDQTDSSISCRKVGQISGNLVSQKRIFKQSKSWFIKSLYIDRIYDKKHNVLVYVSYTKKMSGTNANNSVSVVALNE